MIAVALLGFLFSFRLWGVGTFSVGTGINNWLRMCGLALVALGVHIIAQKATAKRYRAMSHFGIWPLGIAISIIIIFVTNGWFVWAAVGVATVGTARLLRPGRRIEEEGLTLYEIALVMAAGTFANIGLAVLGKLLIPSLGKLAHQFMIMNLWIAVFSVVPLFLGRMMLSVGTSRFFSMFSRKRRPALEKYSYPNKPYLRGPTPMVLPLTLRRIGEQWRSEGEIMLFGSRPLWIFTFVFAVVTAVMILSFSAWLSVLSALALATVLFVIWTHKMEPMRWMRG